MAKAALEAAVWDLDAIRQGVPLWRLLGGQPDKVPCGVSLGIHESHEKLLIAIQSELDSNYHRIKLKIRPGWDLSVLGAVRQRFPHILLMCDANGAYGIEDIPYLQKLDEFNLLMLEQPFPPDDISAYQKARQELQTPICLDETVVSVSGAETSVNLRLADFVNIKMGRVGGFMESREIAQTCAAGNIRCWCGGQHEAGLGRAHNLALASLLPRTIPSELSASTRYWDRDIVIPEIEVDANAFIHLREIPGRGYEIDRAFVDHLTKQIWIHS